MTIASDHAVFHICSRTALQHARAAGVYRADSLRHEGFIHLSQAHQVLPTVQAYFAGVPDLVVLVIDPRQLTAPLRYEPRHRCRPTRPSPPATTCIRTATGPSIWRPSWTPWR
jgi:uncharacterized protein (DUF952 family)